MCLAPIITHSLSYGSPLNSSEQLTAGVVRQQRMLQTLKRAPAGGTAGAGGGGGVGVSAAVYTEITDVETECNGLMTYDRNLKVDAKRVKAANDALIKGK